MSDELPPIRCITCSKVLGHLWKKYEKMLEDGESIEVALNKLDLYRPCCRLRLRNPFKVVERGGQTNQGEITKSFEENFDTLTLSTDSEAPSTGALSALSSVTAMTILPEEDFDVLLPPVPTLSTTKPKTSRMYSAW